jgi:hypothetical protein
VRIIGVLATCSLVALVACAQGPAIEHLPVAVPLPEAGFVPPPVGRQTTWLREDGTEGTWTVVAVDEASYSLRSDKGETATDVTPFFATAAWSVADGAGNAAFDGDPRSLFPLRIGNRAEWKSQGINNGQAFQSATRCTVSEEVRVVVPAGAFDTFKVDCIGGSDLSNPFSRSTYYAPAVSDVVRYHRSNRDTGLVRDRQLVAVAGPAVGAATD